MLFSLLISLVVAPQQELPYAREIAEFKKLDAANPPAKGQIVFIGSSSFTRWTNVGKALPRHKILNRAFGGSTLLEVTARLEDVVFPYEPGQVVLYCGENDFAMDDSIDSGEVIVRFKKLFTLTRKRLPSASFAYVSMKPSPSRWHLAPKFRAANKGIRKFLAREPRTAFVDVWPAMLGKDGLPKPEIFVDDRLHMNDKGYALWTPLLEKVLVKQRARSLGVYSLPWM